MIEISVRDGKKGHVIAQVDDEDAHLAKMSWRLLNGYPTTGRDASMHRLILGLSRGDLTEGDHINRNRLDNRRANLRHATRLENSQNQPAHRRWNASGKDSKARGVDWHKGRWRARVTVNHKTHSLGAYATPEEAAAVVSEWRARLMPYANEPGGSKPFALPPKRPVGRPRKEPH